MRKRICLISNWKRVEFDILAAFCVRKICKKLDFLNSSLVLVLPYPKKDIEYYEHFYDEIIIPTESFYFKAAITERNRLLANNSDLLIANVKRFRRCCAMREDSRRIRCARIPCLKL